MSGDEAIVFVASLVLGGLTWSRWYWRALWPPGIISPHSSRWGMTVPPLLSAIALLAVLANFSSHDVRSDPVYMGFYTAVGAAWVGIGASSFPVLGLNPRDDIVERRNMAAGFAVSGAILGLTLAFAGGNIGDGPGWWVVFFSSGLASAGLIVLWIVVDLATRVVDAVTIDRDTAAGVRFGALLLAAGLILGRGAAGNWVSASGAVTDFLEVAWPAPFLAVAEAFFGNLRRILGSHENPPVSLSGVLPALLYIGAAAAWVVSLGWW